MITGIILTKNEEKNIKGALDSLAFVDEIIVIDDYSTDNTVKIVKEHKNPTVSLHQRKLDDFSSQRNFAQDMATGDYVFFLDADERVSRKLSDEIKNAVMSNDIDGWVFNRSDFIWDRELKFGETTSVKLMRLARKEKGIWKGSVHEECIIEGKTSELKSPILHFPHDTISEFIREINMYTDLRARDLYESQVKTNSFKIISYPAGKFLQNYILRQGFRDGSAGFVTATMMSLHSFLVRGKLWLLWRGK